MTCCGFDWLYINSFFTSIPGSAWQQKNGDMKQVRCRNDGADAVWACLDLTAFAEPGGITLSEESRGWNIFFFQFPISVTQFHRVSIKCDCAAVVVTFVLENKELFPLTSEDPSRWLWLLRTWKLQRNKQTKLNLKCFASWIQNPSVISESRHEKFRSRWQLQTTRP